MSILKKMVVHNIQKGVWKQQQNKFQNTCPLNTSLPWQSVWLKADIGVHHKFTARLRSNELTWCSHLKRRQSQLRSMLYQQLPCQQLPCQQLPCQCYHAQLLCTATVYTNHVQLSCTPTMYSYHVHQPCTAIMCYHAELLHIQLPCTRCS